MAFVLPNCYAKQKDRHISLEFKGKFCFRAIIFWVFTVQMVFKVVNGSKANQATLSIFIKDTKRRSSKTEPWNMTKEMIGGNSKGDCE